MTTHAAQPLPNLAVNALWSVLIALALLAFPLVARHARLHSSPASTEAAPSLETTGKTVPILASADRQTPTGPTSPSR